MKRLEAFIFVVFISSLLIGFSALPREVHLSDSTPLSGTVLIAESFYEQIRGEDELVPLEFQAWPGSSGFRDADWFNMRIEAHPGDVLILSPGQYKADLWVFVSGITITTEPDVEEMAEIWGTVEIDADGIILDRIAVTGPRKHYSSGHGIEVNREVVNRITIRNCLVEDNEWMGIHVIGPRGEIREFRVEDCEVLNNASFGIEVQSVENLIITGCTITGNSEGVHIGSNVLNVEMSDNVISGNRLVDVYQKGQ